MNFWFVTLAAYIIYTRSVTRTIKCYPYLNLIKLSKEICMKWKKFSSAGFLINKFIFTLTAQRKEFVIYTHKRLIFHSNITFAVTARRSTK
jgi:hypothetical protein